MNCNNITFACQNTICFTEVSFLSQHCAMVHFMMPDNSACAYHNRDAYAMATIIGIGALCKKMTYKRECLFDRRHLLEGWGGGGGLSRIIY